MGNKELFELTNPQKSIWYTEQFYEGTTVNNICVSGTLYGKIDEELLKQAINNVVKQNDSFRIHVIQEKNDVRQYIADYEKFNMDVEYINNESEVKQIEKSEAKFKFNIIDSDLFKFKLAISKGNFACIILTVNHLIADSWSLGLVIQEIIKNYNALKNNEDFVPDTFSYLDYIKSEKEYKNSKKFENDKTFWNQTFSTIPEQATIPCSINGVKNVSYNAKRLGFELDRDIVSKINSFCRKNSISTFNFFMAVFSIYIGRVSNIDDFVIGTPILNRSNFKEKHTTGMFISTVPVRFDNINDVSFKSLAGSVATKLMGILRHQKYSYNSILEDIRGKNGNIPNLYNILISYQITKAFDGSLGDYKTDWIFNNYCANDFNIHIYDINDTGSLLIDYDFLVDKYSNDDVINVNNRILYMIGQILENGDIISRDIEIITPDEKNKVLNVFNDTKVDYQLDKTVVDLFEESVDLYPEKTALICNNIAYSYSELNEHANILANILMNKYNVKPNDIVGIMLKRSPELIIGLIAILKCGATYLPIDPDYPEERINYMLENSGTKLVLVDNFTEESVSVKYTKVNIKLTSKVYVDYPDESKFNLNIKLNPNSLMYLIYTSGSTGKPKGVMLSHKNVNNFITGMKNIIDFSPEKTMVSLTTVCFDIFGLELWCSLSSGLTVVLANENEQNNIKELNSLCLKNNVNMIQTTPSRYLSLLSGSNELDFAKNISDVLVGGESLSKNVLRLLQSTFEADIYNMYGPTETTIWSTVKHISADDNLITIGTPIANTKCFVLDDNMHLLPPFTPGNLYIGGDGVSAGYLNRPELTHEKFISSPFEENDLLYNTNDLAYFTSSGELVHLGRSDFQVKLRGYRIELGEIENRILKYPDITNTVVTADESNKYLLCYYVSNVDINHSKLSSYLLKYLPNYMIPAYFKRLDAIPLTPNGKVNRKALPAIHITSECVLASTETERIISGVLSNLLGEKDLDINTPFLTLGLDSLGVIKLQTELLEYNLNLTTQDFYRYPTVKSLAERIDTHTEYYTESIYNIPEQFKHEVDELSNLDLSTDTNELGNVLLTGANGFIGVHVLYELLYNTSSKIHCFVRGDNLNHSIERLDNNFNFYFGLSIKPFLGNRLEIYNGHIVEDNFKLSQKVVDFLAKDVNTIIHTAAIVKHYGNFELFKKTNIDGTRRIAEFAFKNKKRLIHISSLSVSGNYLVKQNNKNVDFSENDLYIGQHYTKNVYVNSKYDAEKIIFSYMEQGLTAEILRVGILSGRYLDGFFQKNISENAFYGRIKSLVDLHCVSKEMLDQKIEFTPVDLCAKSIVLLASSKKAENKVYHLYNHNLYTINEVLDVLKKFDVNIDVVSESDFENKILNVSKDETTNKSLKAIINDISIGRSGLALDYGFTVNLKSDYTQNFLSKFNFTWPKNDFIYLVKLIAYMKYVKFI